MFELDPSLDVAEEARRALLEQADRALAGFDELETPRAVHEARKACKRARALLALIGPGVGRKRARRVACLYRDAARHISSLRDADVMRKTLSGLMGDAAPTLATPTPGDEEVAARLSATIAGLQAAREASERLPWEGLDRRGVLDGFEVGFRAARRGYKAALEIEGAEPMHDWRKVAKANLYHWELLAPLWRPVIGAVHAAIDDLQEVLGDHNDLAVLDDHLDRDALGDSRDAVDERLVERIASLRAAACERGAPVYAVPASVYGSMLLALWKRVPRREADGHQESPESAALA